MRAWPLLEHLTTLGIVVWVDAEGVIWFRDRSGAMTDELRGALLGRYPYAVAELRARPMLVGWIRGATVWHAAMVRFGRHESVYGCLPVRPGELRTALPPFSPEHRICGHCTALLVDRQLARVPVSREART